MTHRQLFHQSLSALLITLCVTLHCFTQTLHAQDADKPSDAESPFKPDKTHESTHKAIAYLLSQQNEDGAINDRRHSNNTTMTSLGIMALAATGHTASDPTPEGRAMRKALDYVLDAKRQTRDGYFGENDGSRMYGHGIITLMLAEMVGMGVDEQQDRLILQRLQKAIDLILNSQQQNKTSSRYHGGWRYTPNSRDADLSVTVWQVMALRAAHNAGIEVPRSAIDDAVGYLRRSYQTRWDGDVPLDKKSAFGYQPGHRPEYATAAAGLLAMQVCGQYEDPTTIGAADWLADRDVRWHSEWFFYGTYYYAMGMHQRGGKYAEDARKNVIKILLDKQESDGSWYAQNGSERGVGKVYATSLGILSLSVKNHFLPIYQR